MHKGSLGSPTGCEAIVIKILRVSSGGVAEKIASAPLGRTSVQTSLDLIKGCCESPLFVSIHFNPKGRRPVAAMAFSRVE